MHDDSASFWADIKEYEERLRRDPDSFLFGRLAAIYLKVGLVDDALHIARQGVVRHPDYIAGQKSLALACNAKGLQDECLGALEKVTLSMPEDGEAQRMLGRILFGRGNIEAAMKALRTALEFNPDDMACRVELEALERGVSQPPAEPKEPFEMPSAEKSAGDHLDAEFGAFDDEAEELDEIIEDLEILDVDEADLLEEEEDARADAEPVAAGVADYNPLPTATLAELYVQQGFIDQALEIYRAVLAQGLDNDVEVRSRIAALEAMTAPSALPVNMENLAKVDWEPPPSASVVPAPVAADDALAVLGGWLDNIRRLKECR